jgi:hypothetical protein
LENKIITRTSEFWKDENGIVWSKPLKGACIDLEDCVDNILVLKRFCSNGACLKIVDSRNSWSITKEAQEYAERADSPMRTIARAVIVNSLTTTVLKNFFLKFNKPELPLKIFNSQEKAIEWLLSFKK